MTKTTAVRSTDFTLIAAPRDWAAALDDLSSQPAFAVDTESNSLHAYQQQVCLIQLSTPRADYLVDAKAKLDLLPLGRLFADPGVQKVFHAAEYDVMCLKRDFGFRFANLFDTMWAARIMGWRRVGLGDLLWEIFGVRTKKRFQQYDWGRRPLDKEALAYAALDVHYLLPLSRMQTEALRECGRWEEAQEVFAQTAACEFGPSLTEAERLWRIKGALELDGREQAVLLALALWRDGEARRRNCPPFRVLHDRLLIALAHARPHSMEELVAVDGFRSHIARRYGRNILQVIRLGECAPVPAPPVFPRRHSEEEVERFQALRAWRKGVAAERGVEADVILGNATLWALAERNPRTAEELVSIKGLGPRKREAYGEAILNVLRGESGVAR